MSAGRFVVAGLAHVRSGWFTDVARWATVGSLPVEFVKCLSEAELRSRLGSGRRWSAVLLDGRLPCVDRDLLAQVAASGAASLVVDHPPRAVAWPSLGATAVLAPPLDRDHLLAVLEAHARPVRDLGAGSGSADAHADADPEATTDPWRAPLVTVLGRSGAGTSTLAAALAQGLSGDARHGGDVLLADLARHAHQAILHDVRDVMPGIQDLAEAGRSGEVSAADVRRLTFTIEPRGYSLLLGLRSPHDWVGLRPAAVVEALDRIRACARLVVADSDADLEGEATSGSFDVEERNQLARLAAARADVVVLAALPTTTGLCEVVRLLQDLRGIDVDPARILVAINRAPRRPRARAALARTVADLAALGGGERVAAGTVFVPERRAIDHLHRDLARFPTALTDPLASGVGRLLDAVYQDAPGARRPHTPEPVPVAPGSLGSWAMDQ